MNWRLRLLALIGIGLLPGAVPASPAIPYTVLDSENTLTIVLAIPFAVSDAAGDLVIAQWQTKAARSCGGAFVGRSRVQITSYAQDGPAFADPLDESERYISSAFGEVYCTGLRA